MRINVLQLYHPIYSCTYTHTLPSKQNNLPPFALPNNTMSHPLFETPTLCHPSSQWVTIMSPDLESWLPVSLLATTVPQSFQCIFFATICIFDLRSCPLSHWLLPRTHPHYGVSVKASPNPLLKPCHLSQSLYHAQYTWLFTLFRKTPLLSLSSHWWQPNLLWEPTISFL